MLTTLPYYVSTELLQTARDHLPSEDFRFVINEPTGNFFYDRWTIKSEFKNTVWDEILKTLPFDIGEARIIILKYGNCYQSHGDIDDRYHLNLSSHYSYLINLETEVMYKLVTDGIWYEMDASPRHSAANFGYHNRIQLVVRKLLKNNKLESSTRICILYKGTDENIIRFKFDNIISPWLNSANKRELINNFEYYNNKIYLDITAHGLNELKKILPDDFGIEDR